MPRPPLFSRIRWSISTRLTLWYGLTLLVLLSLFAVFCYAMFHNGLHRDFDRHLTHEQRELMPFVRLDGGQPRFASLDNLRSVAFQTDGTYGTYVRLLSSNGEILYGSPNLQGHYPLPVRLPSEPEELTLSRQWEEKPARSRYTPLLSGDGNLEGWLEVTGFEWSLHEELRRLVEALILGIVLSVLLAIGGGYLLARRALRPVAALTSGAREIRATDLSARLPTQFGVRDELTELAETFNEMIARLEASFDRERRFTSNAAHELLTPLTTLRNNAEIALRKERDPQTYQQKLKTMLIDAEEMSETVHGLLALSRLERVKELPRERVSLSRLSEEYVARYQERAGRQRIALYARIEPGVHVLADPVHLGEVLDNLLDNALKYTPAGGTVDVCLASKNRMVSLTVSDTGAGFGPEQAGQLFDRFYRADVPEIQSQAGSGLGLSIVQAVAQAYGGQVQARSDGVHRGSTFEVLLPLPNEH